MRPGGWWRSEVTWLIGDADTLTRLCAFLPSPPPNTDRALKTAGAPGSGQATWEDDGEEEGERKGNSVAESGFAWGKVPTPAFRNLWSDLSFLHYFSREDSAVKLHKGIHIRKNKFTLSHTSPVRWKTRIKANSGLFYSWKFPAEKHLQFRFQETGSEERGDLQTPHRAETWAQFYACLRSLWARPSSSTPSSSVGSRVSDCETLLGAVLGTEGRQRLPPTQPWCPRMSPDIARCPWGAKSPRGENHWPRNYTVYLTSVSILCSIFTKYTGKILNSLLLLLLMSGSGSLTLAEATAAELDFQVKCRTSV